MAEGRVHEGGAPEGGAPAAEGGSGRGRLWPLDLWQWLVVGSFLASLVRSSAPLAPYPRAVSGLLVVQAALLALAVLAAWRGRGSIAFRPPAPVLVLAAFGVFALVSALWSIRPSVSVAQAAAVLFIAAFFAATWTWRWQEAGSAARDVDVAFWAVVAVTVLGLALATLRVSWVIGDYYRFIGLTSNANYAGMIAGMMVPVGYWHVVRDRLSARSSWAIATAVLCLSIALSGSRGAAVATAVAVALVHVLARSGWRQLLALVLTTVGAYVVFRLLFVLGGFLASLTASTRVLPGGGSGGQGGGIPDSLGRVAETATDITSGRLDIYRILGRAWLEQPWGGWGYGTTQHLGSTQGLSAHNIFLLVLVELGVVGLGLFLWCLGSIARTGRIHAAPGLAVAGVTVVLMELTESSILGFGGPNSLLAWVILFGWAAEGLASRRGRGPETAGATGSPSPEAVPDGVPE
jgi:O-antigen ligase